jgi:hypothetical protein
VQWPIHPVIQWPRCVTFLVAEQFVVLCGPIFHPVCHQVTVTCWEIWNQTIWSWPAHIGWLKKSSGMQCQHFLDKNLEVVLIIYSWGATHVRELKEVISSSLFYWVIQIVSANCVGGLDTIQTVPYKYFVNIKTKFKIQFCTFPLLLTKLSAQSGHLDYWGTTVLHKFYFKHSLRFIMFHGCNMCFLFVVFVCFSLRMWGENKFPLNFQQSVPRPMKTQYQKNSLLQISSSISQTLECSRQYVYSKAPSICVDKHFCIMRANIPTQ